ncbi:MAG TPA: type II secretion system protein E [Peptococcaceae bacterium]|nr:MAG: Type II secretion system protein E [Clostridia bacterium 41_269]HBT20206.1 type II secretion system protein E [Peptococcaceae bacterium]
MSLLQRLEKEKGSTVIAAESKVQEISPDPYRQLKTKVHYRLIEELESSSEQMEENKEEIEDRVRKLALEILEQEADFVPRSDKYRIVEEMIDEVLGYGPITPLINDDTITEIMVNGPYDIYVERKGKIEKVKASFRDNEHVLTIIEKIVAPLGRRIDESMPMVDARLPDGSRVNAIIPPLSLIGPCITVRKFSKDPYTMKDLIKFGTLTSEMAKLLEGCVKSRLNIIVSGGTGAGKTTLLNCLSAYIPADERIITIEDAAELQLNQPHVVPLETRPPNIEGKGAVTIRDLVRNALRMRPNRIVVGEVRGGEALDMLQAMNTGHDGSITTGHANSPRDMLSRLETMVLMAGMDLPVRAMREQIAGAIDIIVQVSRFRDGSRKVTHITEVLGLEGDTIVTQDIFRFVQEGIDREGRIVGKFTATGIVPKFKEKLINNGFVIPDDLFVPLNGIRGEYS